MPKLVSEQRIDRRFAPTTAVASPVAGSGSGSGGGMAVHELGGPFHSIAAPLDMQGEAITNVGFVDSVDLSAFKSTYDAHIVNVNAHHNRLHDIVGGDDHAVTGAQYSVIGIPTANTLGVLASTTDGSANANTLLRSGASGDLTLSTLTLGTKLRTPLIDTVSGDLTVTPAGSFVKLTDGKAIQNTSTYVSGFAGSGLRIDYGLSFASQAYMELDQLVVRGRMRIFELLIHRIRATNGDIYVSSTGKVKTVTGLGGSSYAIVTDEDHGFLEDDLVRAQQFNGSGVYQSNMQVTAVADLKNYTATLVSGDAPAPGMDFVRLGNTTDTSRQGSIYLSSDDTNAPFIDIIDGVSAFAHWGTSAKNKVRLGKLTGITDSTLGALSGYGLYSQNAYLKGILVAGNGNVQLDSDGGHVLTGSSFIASNRWSLHTTDFSSGTERGFFGGRTWPIGVNSDYQVMISATGVSGGSWGTIALRATKASDGLPVGANDALPGILLVQPESVFIGPNKGLRVASIADELATTVPGGEIYADTIYVDTLVAGSISGTSMSGAEWEFAGSMKIDANSASNTTITISNEGAGRADISVDRDIIVGGTVDGVDLSALGSAYTAHLSADSHTIYLQKTTAGTITAVHTFQPGSATAPFSLHANAQGQTVTGLKADQLNKSVIAGAGLTGGGTLTADITINIGTGDGIQVNADSVAVDSTVVRTSRTLTAGAGLTGGGDLSGDRTFTVGAGAGITVNADDVALTTPGSVSATSTNAATGNHTHAVTASANPGAAEAILKSTSAGGLALQSLLVNGAVTITETLLTGGSGFRVLHHTHDEDHVHVVVNPTGAWTLDEQFGVDIDDNLLVRGWIVGKHAIQLPGAVAIFHFDGPDTNTGGEDRSHMGQVPLAAANNPVYVHGKFGRAIGLGPDAVAMITNGSFETDTSGWTATSATISRVTKDAYHGGWQMQLTPTLVGGSAYTIANANTVNGTNYLFSVWLRGSGSTSARIAIQNNGGTVTYGSATITVTDEWALYACVGAASQVNAARCIIFVDELETVWVDGAQLYQGYNSALSYATASRAGEAYLQYASQGLRPDQGSVMFWARPATNPVGVDTYAFRCFTDATNRIEVLLENSSQNWRVNVANASATSTAIAASRTWSHICVTWGASTARLYVNGVQQGSDQAFTGFGTLATSYYIGYSLSTFRGEIDDVVLASRAVSADEVRAIYESNAPVFAETSTWHFRVGRNLVWGDAEGLWVLNYAGQAAFAVYSGDDDGTGSKSWGGVALNASDILLGDLGRGGYVKWDDSAATLEVKGSITILAGSTGYASITDKPTTLSGINSTEGTKLAGIAVGATVGATWGTNLNSVPTRFGDAPSSAGLYLTATHLGYYNGAAWKAWIAASGNFYFGGDSGAHLEWNGTKLRGIGTNGTTEQWYASSVDGKLYAGGGDVVLDSDGVTLKSFTTYAESSVIKFKSGSDLAGWIGSSAVSGFNQVFVHSEPLSGMHSTVALRAASDSTHDTLVRFVAQPAGATAASMNIAATPSTSTITMIAVNTVINGDTALAGSATVLGTLGVTGNTAMAAALRVGSTGTPSRKIHIQHSGSSGADDLLIESNIPDLAFLESDATANNRIWDFIVNGEQFAFRVVDDALSTATNIMTVDRSGTTVDSVIFPNGNWGFGGQPAADFHVQRATNVELRVEAIDASNARAATLRLAGSGNSNALTGGAIIDFADSDATPGTPGALRIMKGASTFITILGGNGDTGFGGITAPTATIEAARGSGTGGTAIFRGSSYNSIFNAATDENTYIRSGKAGAFVAINDDHAGEVLMAAGGGNVGVGIVGAPAARLDVSQGFSAPATPIPVLKLYQDDLSEEMIEFSATVGAGNPIDGAALGSYYCKVRVSVGGTHKYMPLYNS